GIAVVRSNPGFREEAADYRVGPHPLLEVAQLPAADLAGVDLEAFEAIRRIDVVVTDQHAVETIGRREEDGDRLLGGEAVEDGDLAWIVVEDAPRDALDQLRQGDRGTANLGQFFPS